MRSAKQAARSTSSTPAVTLPSPDPIVVIEPLVVKPTTAARMIDCGGTKIWELCKQGVLDTIQVGADKRVTVESIKRYVAKGGDNTAERPNPAAEK